MRSKGWVEFHNVNSWLINYYYAIITLCDAVGRLFWGVCKKVKKGAVHLGLFLLGPPAMAVYNVTVGVGF